MTCGQGLGYVVSTAQASTCSSYDDLTAACADEFIAQHRGQIQSALATDSPPAARLRGYSFARYRDRREVGTASRHAAELARVVIRVKPERLAEESAMMRGTITAILRDGVRLGTFDIADPDGNAIVFLLSIAYFFPTATAIAPIAEWPREEWLGLVVDWFLAAWERSGSREQGPGR